MSYAKWKEIVSDNVYKILKIPLDKINIDLFNLYTNKFHPYTGSVIAVLKSNEYKAGKIYHSFVIPLEKEIVVVTVR